MYYDYIITPTCPFAKFSALPILVNTPFVPQGYCRVRLSAPVETDSDIIDSVEPFQIGTNPDGSALYLGGFL